MADFDQPSTPPFANIPPPSQGPAKEVEKPRRPSSVARTFLMGVIIFAITIAGASLVYLLIKQAGKSDKHSSNRSSKESQKLEQDFSDLKKKYGELEADRNNVLLQAKNLLQEKAKWTEAEEQLENLKKTNKIFMQQKEVLLSENQKLKAEVTSILQNFEGLKESYQDLLAKQEAADKENASLRDLLTKQVQATPEYQLLDRESKRLREENEKLGQVITSMEAKLKLALDRIKKDQVREISMIRQIRSQKQMLDAIRAQNKAISKTNKELNELISQAPGRIKDMAAQNQALLHETAEMHYNMAVFFTENKQTTQAEREYLRALEFDPNNLKVHYNLGYLYAEEMDKHDKAMFHLEKYLQLAPNSKESEAIRTYIATRQAWDSGDNVFGRGKKK